MSTARFEISCAAVGQNCSWQRSAEARAELVSALAEHLDTVHRVPAAGSAAVLAHLEGAIHPVHALQPAGSKPSDPLRRLLGRLRAGLRSTRTPDA